MNSFRILCFVLFLSGVYSLTSEHTCYCQCMQPYTIQQQESTSYWLGAYVFTSLPVPSCQDCVTSVCPQGEVQTAICHTTCHTQDMSIWNRFTSWWIPDVHNPAQLEFPFVPV